MSDPLQCYGQFPLSMEFSRQEYWRGLPFPLPGDLPNPGIELTSLVSPALTGGFFTAEPLRKPPKDLDHRLICIWFFQMPIVWIELSLAVLLQQRWGCQHRSRHWVFWGVLCCSLILNSKVLALEYVHESSKNLSGCWQATDAQSVNKQRRQKQIFIIG